jgi:hypothetical protein
MVVLNLDDEYRLDRDPFARASRRPTAWSARRAAGESGSAGDRFDLGRDVCSVAGAKARREADVV